MSTEREAFEAYWNSLADDPDSTPEVIARCRYSAMNAWQAALAQPAVPLTEARAFEIWERAAQIDLSGRVNELIRIKDAQCVIRSILMAAKEKP